MLPRKASRSDSLGGEKLAYEHVSVLAEDPERYVQCDLVRQLNGSSVGKLYIDKHTSIRQDHHVACAAMRELEVHLALQRYSQQHPNVLLLQRSFMEKDRLHLLLEYCEMQSLESILADSNGSGRLDQLDQVRTCVRQVCEGLAFVHARGIAHLSLAIDCLHLTHENIVKIGNFSRARLVHTASDIDVPSSGLEWCAPELLEKQETSFVDLQKADSWSLGVLLVTLLCRQLPFRQASSSDSYYRVLRRRGVQVMLERTGMTERMLCELSPELVDLLESLFRVDPQMRLSMREVLDHPFLRVHESS